MYHEIFYISKNIFICKRIKSPGNNSIKCLPEQALGRSTSLPCSSWQSCELCPSSSDFPKHWPPMTYLQPEFPLLSLWKSSWKTDCLTYTVNYLHTPQNPVKNIYISVLKPDCNKNIHPFSKYLFCVGEERPDLSLLIINIVFHSLLQKNSSAGPTKL